MELTEIRKQYEDQENGLEIIRSGLGDYSAAREQFIYAQAWLTSNNAVGKLLTTIDQQQTEIERLRAALYEAKQCLNPNTTDYEYIEQLERGNQQPEPPQESLKVRILRVLAMAADNDVHRVAINRMVNEDARLVDAEIAELDFCQLIDTTDSGWQITAAGREYLASLDKPTIEIAEDYLSQLD